MGSYVHTHTCIHKHICTYYPSPPKGFHSTEKLKNSCLPMCFPVHTKIEYVVSGFQRQINIRVGRNEGK